MNMHDSSHSNHSGDTREHGEHPFLKGLLIVAIIVLGIWWLVSSSGLETSFEGIKGVQGIVTSIDDENSSFVILQRKLKEKGDEYSFEENVFTVRHTDNTDFIIYLNPIDVKEGIERPADITDIELSQNVVITPSNQVENTITAAQIRIIPGSAEGTIESIE